MTATIHIERFWTAFEPDSENPGQLRAVDWVSYGPVGSLDKCLTRDKIARLQKVMPDLQNPTAKIAHMRWQAIKPYYDAWKAGQEMPESGTPLAAWNGVSTEQADALRARQIKTVEDLAQLTDSHVQRFGLPGLRDIIEGAKRYLAGSDARVAAAKMEEMEAENRSLRDELEEIKQMLLKEAAEPKRGPGRPRKAEAEAA